MKKYGKKILAGMVTCLIFLFVMTSLFGCKWTSLKGEPEFRIVQLSVANEMYDVKIPSFMPDFTKFKDTDI